MQSGLPVGVAAFIGRELNVEGGPTWAPMRSRTKVTYLPPSVQA